MKNPTYAVKRTDEILELVPQDNVRATPEEAVKAFKIFCDAYEDLIIDSKIRYTDILMRVAHLQSIDITLYHNGYGIVFKRD